MIETLQTQQPPVTHGLAIPQINPLHEEFVQIPPMSSEVISDPQEAFAKINAAFYRSKHQALAFWESITEEESSSEE